MIKDDRKLYKQRAQVKSRFYYLFWGIATVSVVAGQLYVGSGYRMFARSLNRIFDTVEVQVSEDYYRERYYQLRIETREAMEMLFSAKWNLPQAAKHCRLTHKEMKITFSEYCALHDADYKPPAPAIQLHLNYDHQ